MPEFKSWLSFRDFEDTVKHISRYVYDQNTKEFVDTVLATSKSRHHQVPQGEIYWRAQLGHDLAPLTIGENRFFDEPVPFSKERMKPPSDTAREGRANPKGIPFLYASTDKDTAMAEVRPWLDSLISVACLKVLKDLTVVDCTDLDGIKDQYYFQDPDTEETERAVWSAIGRAFSKPVTPNDGLADYVPTQIIAELFKNNGLDGVLYTSTLGKGNNIVLFNMDTIDVVKCTLYRVTKIDVSFIEGHLSSILDQLKRTQIVPRR